MEVSSEDMAQTTHDAAARTPRKHDDSQDDQPLPTDSMVTVPLSETDGAHAIEHDDDNVSTASLHHPYMTIAERRLSSRPTSAEILQGIRERDSRDGSMCSPTMDSPTISLPDEGHIPLTPTLNIGRPRSTSDGSNESAHVDWAELDKAEEQEPQEKGQDDVSLLHRIACSIAHSYRPWHCSLHDWSRKTMLSPSIPRPPSGSSRLELEVAHAHLP